MADIHSVEDAFNQLEESFQPEKAAGVDAVFQFNLAGDNGGQYWAKVADQQLDGHEGTHPNPDLTLSGNADDFIAMVNGDLNPMTAFMQGKIKVKGEMGLALKLQAIFGLG